MTKKIDSAGWITWEGGDAPLAPYVEVEVQLRGIDGVDEDQVGNFMWYHTNEHRKGEIVAYRVKSDPVKVVAEQYDESKCTPAALRTLRNNSGVDKMVVTLSLAESDNPNDIQTGGTHYKDMGIEPWDVIDTWPIEQQIGYHRGNILKYTMRMGSKDERLKEAKKIAHYAQKLVSVLEKEND